ncbi:MAG TPA: GNAT family N-acetyltransferase [Verrucomicrobiae bacterium]|nr:GNAT family N-acetyltransferase [Verrucomicrobiae bacterium]
MTGREARRVRLQPATTAHPPQLVPSRPAPESVRWGGADDLAATISAAIELAGRVVGWSHAVAAAGPDHRHPSLDVEVDPVVHDRGDGPDAVRRPSRRLVEHHGHACLEIEPAADTPAAIRSHSRVGFRPVGVTRRGEFGPDGLGPDGLRMDLLAGGMLPAGPAQPGDPRASP